MTQNYDEDEDDDNDEEEEKEVFNAENLRGSNPNNIQTNTLQSSVNNFTNIKQ